MIQANSRLRLTAADFEFVASAVSRRGGDSVALEKLVADEAARDALLDDKAVFDALLDLPEPLPISAHLYFYVVTRHALMGKGVENRNVADYVANLLTQFSRADRVHRLGSPTDTQEYKYIVDLMAAAEHAPSEKVFLIHSQLGNYSLFITGIFPQHVQHRVERRGAPSMEFYEDVGSASYRLASDHAMAKLHTLTEIYRSISEQFRDIRLALNRMAEAHLHLEGAGAAERALLADGEGAK